MSRTVQSSLIFTSPTNELTVVSESCFLPQNLHLELTNKIAPNIKNAVADLDRNIELIIKCLVFETESVYTMEHCRDNNNLTLQNSTSNHTICILSYICKHMIDECGDLRSLRYHVPCLPLPKNAQWVSDVLLNLPDNHFMYHCRMSRKCFSTICHI